MDDNFSRHPSHRIIHRQVLSYRVSSGALRPKRAFVVVRFAFRLSPSSSLKTKDYERGVMSAQEDLRYRDAMKKQKRKKKTEMENTNDSSQHGNLTESGGGGQVVVQEIRADYDDEGVWFYQAFKDSIADWAVEHQTLGGPEFLPARMTWIKPSFAWVLYRSGYATKHNQERILKIKIGHDAVAELLSKCACGHGGGGTTGRVQWDPERDIMSPGEKGREPLKMQRIRAIQIGLSKELSELYVNRILCVEDVTVLARRVGEAHAALSKNNKSDALEGLVADLPNERPYTPHMDDEGLQALGLLPKAVAK